jgi:hypothetical protein
MTNQPTKAAVTGYMPQYLANDLLSAIKTEGAIELRFEKGNDEILMRVKHSDVVECGITNEGDGEAKVHLLLRPDSHVETVVKMFQEVDAIEDPTLSRLTPAATVSVSFG